MTENKSVFHDVLVDNSHDQTEADRMEHRAFADGSSFLNETVNFISIELFNGARVFNWFSADATVDDLFRFVLPHLGTNENIDFYFKDKDAKHTESTIRWDRSSCHIELRKFLNPLNKGSTRNRFSLITLRQ